MATMKCIKLIFGTVRAIQHDDTDKYLTIQITLFLIRVYTPVFITAFIIDLIVAKTTNGKYYCDFYTLNGRGVCVAEFFVSIFVILVLIGVGWCAKGSRVARSLRQHCIDAFLVIFGGVILSLLFYSLSSSIIDFELFCKENTLNLCPNFNSTKLVCSITDPNAECIAGRMIVGFFSLFACVAVILVAIGTFLCLRGLCRETKEIIIETTDIVIRVEQ